MTWFQKHRHRWRPVAVRHGTVQGSGVAGTQILQRCQHETCGAYATQTIYGCWELDDICKQAPEQEVAELRRLVERQ